MYMDDVVIAGIITIASSLAVIGGVAWFIWNDIKRSKRPN